MWHRWQCARIKYEKNITYIYTLLMKLWWGMIIIKYISPHLCRRCGCKEKVERLLTHTYVLFKNIRITFWSVESFCSCAYTHNLVRCFTTAAKNGFLLVFVFSFIFKQSCTRQRKSQIFAHSRPHNKIIIIWDFISSMMMMMMMGTQNI